MFKKLAIGLLSLTVLGVVGTAIIYNITSADPASAEEAAAAETAVAQENAQGNAGAGYGQQGTGNQDNQGNQAAEASLGEPWMETGVVTAIEDNGIEMTLESGETAFVELGPVEYWTSQGIAIVEGDTVTIDGSINEGMIHATTLTTADGQIMQLRNENGQPMWSGGASNEQGQNGQDNGEPQIVVDEWITVEGTLMSFQGGNMSMSTSDGEILNFQTGQPRFFAEQNVTFQVGDEIIVVGFYQGEQFQAGDITQVSTGEKVMLRDPNGRPLWAGPGNWQW